MSFGKPVLYTFGPSVWAAVPALAIPELGYSEDAIEIKVVNLAEGQNFTPAFLKINPRATLPTLEAAGKAYTSTKEVTDYLVKHAPAEVAKGTDLIDIVHEDKYDPNFIKLAARSDAELAAKADGFPKTFVANRQKALHEYSAHPEASAHSAFYGAKKQGNGGILAIYEGKSSEDTKNAFIAQSQRHWVNIARFVTDVLPERLPERGFVGGERPGEDDFHVGAWLARVVATLGGRNDKDGVQVLEKELDGKKLPPQVVNYWASWIQRPSWQKVYSEGLH
ncbi:hypothetical protein PUNSTDRAFT_109749 [Punctularia strigosozonata HHB-11173 SS5]|uniref:uncharacterized protein n=1 Tax=Punctularia strigosozonata (strain HHB-11173) TaxID=741275 RepID=UPI0004418308|nr:uncharacterized protein PUNSTDRAFT_109749 [Punctularia strigosozonata HHB-11173 SS5]EIN13551.1 hypothetical protein PUNSTDRAFT_109749 [Punctularia strigosozonata HHB-11173 SS5]